MSGTIMLKEIKEQISVIERIESKNKDVLEKIAFNVTNKNITCTVFAGRGTSDNAGKYGAYMLSIYCNMIISDMSASTITLSDAKPNFKNNLVIGVSQSGKAEDVLHVLKQGNSSGAITVAITNDENSPMALEAQYHLFCNAGEEKSVAATKTFSAELVLLALLTAYISKDEELLKSVKELPHFLEQTLNTIEKNIQECSAKLKNSNEAFILGRSYMYPVALEAALKTQETCYIRAKGYAISDFYHGPIAQIDEKVPVLVLIQKGRIFDDACQMIEKLQSLGNNPIIITNDTELFNREKGSILLPDTGVEATSIFPFVLFVQNLAERISVSKGLNPDVPRALKKVTITK